MIRRCREFAFPAVLLAAALAALAIAVAVIWSGAGVTR
jgi:hypothetical protein